MVDWIVAHYVEIFALLGAIYTAARIIVALTPTPKDDEVVGALWRVVQALAKLVGLDPQQGLRSGKGSVPPPPPAGVAAFIALSLLLGGCGAEWREDPKAELLVAQKTFTAVVNAMTDLRRAGKLNDDDVKIVAELILTAQEELHRWQAAVEAGQPPPTTLEGFRAVLARLIQIELDKGGAP